MARCGAFGGRQRGLTIAGDDEVTSVTSPRWRRDRVGISALRTRERAEPERATLGGHPPTAIPTWICRRSPHAGRARRDVSRRGETLIRHRRTVVGYTCRSPRELNSRSEYRRQVWSATWYARSRRCRRTTPWGSRCLYRAEGIASPSAGRRRAAPSGPCVSPARSGARRCTRDGGDVEQRRCGGTGDRAASDIRAAPLQPKWCGCIHGAR